MTPKPDDKETNAVDFALEIDKIDITTTPVTIQVASGFDDNVSSVIAPVLDPEDDLHKPINVDINGIVDKLWDNRGESPIVPRADPDELAKVEKDLAPREGLPLNEVVDYTTDLMMKYCRHISHPGHFGYLAPQGLRTDPLGFAMTAAANQNVAMYSSSPIGVTLEHTVIQWLCEIIGYDLSTGPSGVLLSGGSSSNLTAVATALAHHYGPEYRSKGLGYYVQKTGKIPVILCSEAAHFCFQRACGMVGIGVDNCITIPSDENFCMRMDLLEEAIAKYEDQGIAMIAATAGTTLTGGIDDLPAVAKICEEKNIWFHVDAAYGGSALMSPELKPLLAGIERADSVTMDLHKWFYMSLDCSAIVYKNPFTVKSLFSDQSASLKSLALDKFADKGYLFFLLGPELSRRMRALPMYIAFKHFGMGKMGRNVLFNVQSAKYMSDLVKEDKELDLVYESKLSICLFRMILPEGYKHRDPKMSEDEVVDALNAHIRQTVEDEDQYYMSGASIKDRPVLRCCLVSYRHGPAEVVDLLSIIKRIGRAWIKENNMNATATKVEE